MKFWSLDNKPVCMNFYDLNMKEVQSLIVNNQCKLITNEWCKEVKKKEALKPLVKIFSLLTTF